MKTIAKIFALAMSVMMLCAAFAGCGDNGNTIVYGTSADYAPYEFHTMIDGKDTIVGYDVARHGRHTLFVLVVEIGAKVDLVLLFVKHLDVKAE